MGQEILLQPLLWLQSPTFIAGRALLSTKISWASLMKCWEMGPTTGCRPGVCCRLPLLETMQLCPSFTKGGVVSVGAKSKDFAVGWHGALSP